MSQIIINDNNDLTGFEKILKEINPKKVIIFSGKSILKKIACREQFFNILENFDVEIYSRIAPNPTDKSIQEAVSYLPESDDTCLIAIGGGSVIDTAKSALFLTKKNISLIAIPTTCGTGSESTQFATYYKNKIKQSFDDPSLLPKYVILSEMFIKSLPKNILAETSADALSQAIESYWNIRSTDESRLLAARSIKLIIQNLKIAYDTYNSNALGNLLNGANLAGQAINITRTTAPHSISYPITSFFGASHGQAVSISLPEVMNFNKRVGDNNCNDPRGTQFTKDNLKNLSELISGDENSSKFLTELFESVGLKVKLRDLLSKKEDIDLIIEHGFTPNRMKNNPRLISKSELKDILEQIF